MKKSILHVSKPKLIGDLKKMISEKKKQFKEMFSFKRSKDDKKSPRLPGPNKLSKEKSQYKLSKDASEKKTPNLIEIPNDEKPIKSLFTDVELYKIIGTIDQKTTPSTTNDWMMELEPSKPTVSSVPSRQESRVEDVMTTKELPESRYIPDSGMGSGSPELNMYRMFVGLHK